MEFHPFNPYKLLTQYHRWSRIREGCRIPSPAIISLDPINACNLRCGWCNSQKVIDNSNRHRIRTELLLEIPRFLADWRGIPEYPQGVLAVCIAGGGESLLHEGIDHLILRLHALGIDVGLITNGLLIHEHLESLSSCNFVGVSVDASTRETFRSLKEADGFDRVIQNIRKLSSYAYANKAPLVQGSGRGIGYKFLAMPENVHEISEAANTAKEIGCSLFHVRPADVGWFDKATRSLDWRREHLERFRAEMKQAESVQGIQVKGITDKFSGDFSRIEIPYPKCVVGAMTGVIAPSRTNGVRFSICCDRKGDESTFLIDDTSRLEDISDVWGSEQHWKLCGDLDLTKCPRCTYLNHLKVYYGAVLDDSMNVNMI